jgi:AcrR family transcriptional regulator
LPESSARKKKQAAAAKPRGEERKRALIEAAFASIAEEGFEGLRTRDIAKRAGVNVATLHHYFPTKEALVRAVAIRLAALHSVGRAPAVGRDTSGALTAVEELRIEFADARYFRVERPDIAAVWTEFALRAGRDKALQPVLSRINAAWQTDIERVLDKGVRDGTFRPDLDPKAGAHVVMATLWSATSLVGIDAAAFERACKELERWLTAAS